MTVRVQWISVGDNNERPIRERSLWLAMPNGTVMIGFRGQAHEIECPYAPVGEVAWRGVDGEPMSSEPTHWAYIEVPEHPAARVRRSRPGLPNPSPGDDWLQP